MQEYYFLFILAFIWTLFATIQDLKSREVANWLNFSLLAIALAYRAFFSLQTKNPTFLIQGLIGFAIMFVIANIFYYSSVFAGGDAKLLMAFGAILPYPPTQLALTPILKSILPAILIFILLLLIAGAIYSIAYSIFIVAKNKKQFTKEFKKRINKHKITTIVSTTILLISLIISTNNPLALSITLIALIPLTFFYTKSLESCLIKLTPPEKLTEGDWLVDEIKISKTQTIKKTVHGLSKRDIKLLKKHNKKVLIKNGIPFVPAFLLALIITALFEVVLSLPLASFLP